MANTEKKKNGRQPDGQRWVSVKAAKLSGVPFVSAADIKAGPASTAAGEEE